MDPQKQGEVPPPYGSAMPYPPSGMNNPGYGVGPSYQAAPPGQYYPPPQQQVYNPYPPQTTSTVIVTSGESCHPVHHGHHGTTTVFVERGHINHALHCCISFFFFPWLFVWLFLCMTEG